MSQTNEISVSCVNIEAPSWLEDVQPFTERICDRLEIQNWEVSILFCDDPFIHDLNLRYRHKDRPTDILSFPQDNPYLKNEEINDKFPAGDIIISIDTLEEHSVLYKVPFDQELKRLLIHGILHLSGMDHENEESEMLILQENILEELMEEIS